MIKAEIINITDYKTFKETLGAELRASAEGFVRIGYLLKQARDTDILAESGYKNLTEFAEAEYGLTKDIVSRYIAINDKYSVNGYSDQLRDEYQGYGVAKLAEMLTLPKSVVDEMRPELTKAEIREIKEAVKEEEKISDIEVAIEASENNISNTGQTAESKGGERIYLLTDVLREILRLHPDKFCDIWVIMTEIYDIEARKNRLNEVLCPAGYMLYTVRVKGVGTILLKCESAEIGLTNVRTNERSVYTWSDIEEACDFVTAYTDTPEKVWEKIYGEAFPVQEVKKEKVAPAQPTKDKPKKKEKKKEKPEHVSTSIKKEKELKAAKEEKKNLSSNSVETSIETPVETPAETAVTEEIFDPQKVKQYKEKAKNYAESVELRLNNVKVNIENGLYDVAKKQIESMLNELKEINEALDVLIKQEKLEN